MPEFDPAKNNGKKRSLILAGGGMRLAYQGGVLAALEENGFSFDHIDGTSGGIFNAGMLASGLGPKEIRERWRKLKIKHFMSARPLKKYFKPLNMSGYADADGIRNRIFPDLGIDIQKINKVKGRSFTFNVCNFSDKTIEAVPHDQVLEDHLIAGVSLPIVMPALKIEDSWYSDAVWIKDANLKEAVKRGAEELWLVWAIGNTKAYLPGALNQYVHMIEMSANGGLLEEYEQIQLYNEEIERGKGRYGQKNKIKLFLIKPDYPLPLDPDFFFNKIDARSLVNMGYADGKRCLDNMPENGFEFDKKATTMKDPGTRFNIRNEFHGELSFKNESVKASYYSFLVFSQRTEGQVVHEYSSIRIAPFGQEISCFDHHLSTNKSKGVSEWTSVSVFIHRAEEFVLSVSWKLYTPTELLIGLSFKKVRITVLKNNELVAEGVLYQNLKSRIKSRFAMNIRKPDGTGGGLGLKYGMAKKLVNYAV